MSAAKEKYLLLIEDNEDDIELTQMALEKYNIVNNIVIKRDGEEAIDFLFEDQNAERNDKGYPSLILLDLNMPKIDGFEVLKKLRATDATRFIPVAILTSSKEEEDIIRSYENGANSYIRKPVNFNEFLEAVKQLGMYWLMLNEPPI